MRIGFGWAFIGATLVLVAVHVDRTLVLAAVPAIVVTLIAGALTRARDT